MRNLEVVENFVSGYDESRGSNLYIEGNKLINYTTVIAYRVPGKILLNNDFCSRITSVHQNRIREEVKNYKNLTLIEVSEEWLMKVVNNEWDVAELIEEMEFGVPF